MRLNFEERVYYASIVAHVAGNLSVVNRFGSFFSGFILVRVTVVCGCCLLSRLLRVLRCSTAQAQTYNYLLTVGVSQRVKQTVENKFYKRKETCNLYGLLPHRYMNELPMSEFRLSEF